MEESLNQSAFSRNHIKDHGNSSSESPFSPKVSLQRALYMALTAQRELVLTADEASVLSRDRICQLVDADFKPYQDRIEKLEEIKWELLEMVTTHWDLRNDPWALSVQQTNNETIDKLRGTVRFIKQEALQQQISSFRRKISVFQMIDPPQFSGNTNLLHFFEWKELFLSYLKSSNIALPDSSALWRKALIGKAKKMVDYFWPDTYIPNYLSLLEFLEEHFGNTEDILAEILEELKKIGEIPGGYIQKWGKALDSTTRALILLNKLESLARANPQKALYKSTMVQDQLHRTIPSEHFYYFEEKLAQPGADALVIFREILKKHERQALKKEGKGF